MKNRITHLLFIALISVFAISLVACGKTTNNESAASTTTPAASTQPATPASGKITVQDAVGTLELPKKPERIIAMEFGFTDILVSIGTQPVGVADDSSPDLFMDSVKSKLGTYTSVGSRYEPNIELISSLKPDLIIVEINKHKNAIPQLKGIAPVLVLDDFQADYNQMLKNVAIISKAVGKEEEGKKRMAEHQATVETLKKKLGSTNLRVLPAVVNPKGFFAHSDHAYSGSFLAMLGYTDPVKNAAAYPQITLEQLAEANPQVLFLLPTEKETIVKQWETNPLWQKIDAVANKKVYTVERRDWSLSRGMLGSEKILADLVKNLGQ
ncbi:iron citrate ABC transporter substrate-binding protein [Paenibacillus marchantiophytorum]|uniref:Iron citrate ABC transporter substrate-binding protein n=1 Tax=Paenibacillus marchantiophytorum TaxID=1619310 RepID=A0ABQ1EP51_9BACL|nr:ABC transporter substrate-binding protein [Paenibacillus marchantiophytorum]GFZ80884.1 iron citrate ABC transporter substrate-binding protein [Paenibacillus marchantiophytorum]